MCRCMFYFAPLSAAVTTGTPISNTCDKCGVIKKTGKLSCCAPGGAWHKNCGDEGDPKFDHTWFDGIQACKSKYLGLIDMELKVDW